MKKNELAVGAHVMLKAHPSAIYQITDLLPNDKKLKRYVRARRVVGKCLGQDVTLLVEEIAGKAASGEIIDKVREASALVAIVGEILASIPDDPAAIDWSHVGSMGFVVERLREIVNHYGREK